MPDDRRFLSPVREKGSQFSGFRPNTGRSYDSRDSEHERAALVVRDDARKDFAIKQNVLGECEELVKLSTYIRVSGAADRKSVV